MTKNGKANNILFVRSIIYINFAQYDNVGRILDFLKKRFPTVVQFSYDHLRLKRGSFSTFLRVYENGVLVKEVKLVRLWVPEILRFPSLPILAFLMVAQTLWYSLALKKRYKKFDFFMTLDAFSAWTGNLLRKLGLVENTIFWVGDYFPLDYPEWRIKILRWIYWKFDKPSMQNADRLLFTNRKLFKLYNKMGILQKSNDYLIVPIGTKPEPYLRIRENCIIGFLGMIKNSQGLELIFDVLPRIFKEIRGAKIEIVGSGPQEDYFRHRARKFGKKITFHGFIKDQEEIHNIVRKWSIGLAPYQPVKSNESYWGDPSKIKVYLSAGVPVITTDVSYIVNEIRKYNAGVIIDYYNHNEFLSAIKTIIKKKTYFQKNAFFLAQKYNYNKIYSRIFLGL